MDLSFLTAMPIGLLMFAALAAKFFRRKAGQQRAQADYPALAQRLGLSYRSGGRPNQIGQLHGVLRGFRVAVDPDEQRKLIVRFRSEPRIDFRSYEGPRCPADMFYFSTGNRDVDRFFPTRFVSHELAERLDGVDWAQLLQPFRTRYRKVLKELNITQHGVTCALDFGNPPHIPADVVAELLPAMVDWAEAVESTDYAPAAPARLTEV
jgi:hypothetical protein